MASGLKTSQNGSGGFLQGCITLSGPLFLLILAVFFFLPEREADQAFESAAAEKEPERVLLLPFTNATDDPEFDWYTFGLRHVVASGLERVGIPLIADPPLDAALIQMDRHYRDLGTADMTGLMNLLAVDLVIATRIERAGNDHVLVFEMYNEHGRRSHGERRSDRGFCDNLSDVIGRMTSAIAERYRYMEPPAFRYKPEALAAWAQGINRYHRQGGFTATALFEQALAADPTLHEARAWLARARLDSGAIAEARQLLAGMPQSRLPEVAFLVRGNLALLEGDLDAAEMSFRAIQSPRFLPDAWSRIIALKALQGADAEAREQYTIGRAQLGPLFSAEDITEAIKINTTEAQRRNRETLLNRAPAWYSRAGITRETYRSALASQSWLEPQIREPMLLDLYRDLETKHAWRLRSQAAMHLIHLYLTQEQDDRALDIARDTLEWLRPIEAPHHHARFHLQIARILMIRPRSQNNVAPLLEADRHLEPVFSFLKQYPIPILAIDAHHVAGMVYLALSDLKTARTHFQAGDKNVADEIRMSRTHIGLATVAMHQKQWEPAKALLQKANITLKNDSGLALALLARCAYETGNGSQAHGYALQAEMRQPGIIPRQHLELYQLVRSTNSTAVRPGRIRDISSILRPTKKGGTAVPPLSNHRE